jgi:hypothetical protein
MAAVLLLIAIINQWVRLSQLKFALPPTHPRAVA